jgi:hypothetical protein
MDMTRCLSAAAEQHLRKQNISLDAFIVPKMDSAISDTITKYFAEQHSNESPSIQNSVRFSSPAPHSGLYIFCVGRILYREGSRRTCKQAVLHLF